MFIERKFDRFVSKDFNDAVWIEVYELAAWNKIRLCRARDVFETIQDDGNQVVNDNKKSHYYSSFSRLNMKAKDWYAKKMFKKHGITVFDELQELQKQLESDTSHIDIEDENQVQEFMFDQLSKMTGETLPKLMSMMEEGMAKVQSEMDRTLKHRMDTGIIYPWDYARYEIERINLREKPLADYKGKTLDLSARNGVIQSISISR